MTYPTITPKLTLDFANSRQLDPRITFSRSSTATYLHPDTGLITTAPSGVARFEKEGFLVEEARTNELPYSEDFSDSSWTKVNTTVTTNAATAPDGTSTANRLQIGATNGVVYNNTVGGVASNSTISMWVKAVNPGTDDVFRLASAGDLSADLTATNEWVRYTFTSSTTTSSLHGIARPADNTAADVYVWGAQFEEDKTFPTSYIPTSGSTVTRADDVSEITGTNFSSWYGGLSGTLAHESVNNSNASSIPLVCDDGTNANRILFNNSGSYQLQIRVSGATIVQMGANPGTAPSGMTKYAGSYEVGNASVSFDGVSNTTTATSIPQCSRLQISQFSGNPKFNTISRISYYDRRVSDAELETLTS